MRRREPSPDDCSLVNTIMKRARGICRPRREEHERRQIANFSVFCNLYFTARGGLKFLSYMHGLLLPRGGFSSICRRVASVRSLLINSQLCVRANAGCKCSVTQAYNIIREWREKEKERVEDFAWIYKSNLRVDALKDCDNQIKFL